MDISRGYVRLFRQIDEWEWYDNPAVKSIFLHCLIKANDKAKRWRELTLKRGQFVTSYEKLAAANGLTIQQTRTALKQLQITHEIEYQTTNQYTVITVLNFNLYQATNTRKSEADTIPNNKRNGGQVTTTNNIDSNTSYINISLSNKKIKKDEREILRNYLLRQKRKPDNLEAYIKTLINNGDWVEIVEKEKKRLQAREEKKKNEQRTVGLRVIETEEEQEKIRDIQERIKKGRRK